MDINRHNYEHFFLLYIDNELSVKEKGAVAAFVKANPDLEEELLMLQQSVLRAEPIEFADKDQLFKNAPLDADIQEQLLLHLDNELTASESLRTEDKIASDATVAKEWNLLQQTILPAEVIIFKEKHLLYRKQGGKLIGFSWRKLAVAAGLVGLIAFGVQMFVNQQQGANRSDSMAGGTTVTTPEITKPAPSEQQPGSDATESPIQSTPELADAEPVKKANDKLKNNHGIDLHKADTKSITTNSTIAIKKPALVNSKKDLLPGNENFNEKESNKTIATNVPPSKQSDAQLVTQKQTVETQIIEQGPAINEYASTAAYTNNEENDNRVLFLDESTIKKSKLGGVFKKVKRVFERNTNISTGANHLKIANLEFAIQ